MNSLFSFFLFNWEIEGGCLFFRHPFFSSIISSFVDGLNFLCPPLDMFITFISNREIH